MAKRLSLLGLLAALVASPALATHYDVYLLAGQSNMDGRGSVQDLKGDLAPYAGERPGVLLWYSNGTIRHLQGHSAGWVPLQPGFAVPPGIRPTDGATTQPAPGGQGKVELQLPFRYFGPEVGFAKAMHDAEPDRQFALIKFTVGGSNLKREWNPQRKLLYEQFVTAARAALQALTARGDTYTVCGFLWHQGESDATVPEADYEKLLGELLNDVRKEFKDPNLPIVLGEPFDNGKRISIRIAQRNLAKKMENVYCVSSVGLKTADRETHFNAASQVEIGRRFAEAILKKQDAGPVPTTPTTAPSSTQPSVEEP